MGYSVERVTEKMQFMRIGREDNNEQVKIGVFGETSSWESLSRISYSLEHPARLEHTSHYKNTEKM